MEENVQKCFTCRQYNDQMLMLSCVHDPCIDCASIHYSKQSKGNQKYNYYTCQICNQKTFLDISTVSQLNKIILENGPRLQKNKKQYNQNNQTRKNQFNLRSDNTNLSSKRHQIPKQTNKNLQDTIYKDTPTLNRFNNGSLSNKRLKMCKEHVEQQVSYYCFECYINICPQCAIHGNHKGHDVKSIKKAIGQIRKQFNRYIERMQKNQQNLKISRQNNLRVLKEYSEQNIKLKNTIKKQFDIFREQLLKKQRQLIRQVDELNTKNVNILNIEIQTVNNGMQIIKNVIKSIQIILKKDDISILQEYGQKKQTLNYQIQKKTYNIQQKQKIYSKIQKIDHSNLIRSIKNISQQIHLIKIQIQNHHTQQHHIYNHQT